MTINFDGNIGKTAELRKVKVGGNATSVCSVWIAENIRKRDNETKTLWHKVTIWRKYAETMAQYLTEGRHVLVEGYAEAKVYTTKDNRVVPYIDVQATKLKLLDKKTEEELPPEAEAATVSEEESPWD